MTSTATVVFKSGVAIEVEVGKDEADKLLTAFDDGWDEDGVTIALNLAKNGNAIRAVASDISGIFIDDTATSEAEEEDEEDEEDDDIEDDEEEDEAETKAEVVA